MKAKPYCPSSGGFLLHPRSVFSFLFLLSCGCLYPVTADSLTGSNGLTLTGEIVSMVEGELTFKTQVGIHKLPMNEVKSFTIDRGASVKSIQSASNQSSSIDVKQLLDRLDSLASTLANLERQILRVQTTQETQIRQVDQRTYDLNPERSLKVANTRLNKRSSATVVTGQIINESASQISNVQAEVVLYGRTGRLRLSGGEKRQTVPVSPVILEPGQTGTFTAQFEGGLVVSNFEVFPKALIPGGYNSNLKVQPNASQF
jgi:hypothetical protein